jgi:hypothetical protein
VTEILVETANQARAAIPTSKLEVVRILSVGKSGNCGVRTQARNLYADWGLGLGARLSQDGKARQRLAVNLGD